MESNKNFPLKRSFSKKKSDKPIPQDIYPVIDTDLARDNIENDLSDIDI
ncbi:MAG: hypothetical protein ACOX8S_06690 [Christensenellales bacterium]